MDIYVVSKEADMYESAKNIGVRLTLNDAKDRAEEAIKADKADSTMQLWTYDFDIDRNMRTWYSNAGDYQCLIEEFVVNT